MPDLKGSAVKFVEYAGSVVGLRWGTEEPSYTVVEDREGIVEIRRYGPRVAAETSVRADDDAARSIGFRRLAGYIFGGNHRATKIAMTAPVVQQIGERIAMTAPVAQISGSDGESVIRFFMPSEFAFNELPEPDDAKVRIVEVPAETVAVLRFTGDRSAKEVARRMDSLLASLRGTTYQVIGTPVAWFYDPPFTLPFRRRNEIAVTVVEGSAR